MEMLKPFVSPIRHIQFAHTHTRVMSGWFLCFGVRNIRRIFCKYLHILAGNEGRDVSVVECSTQRGVVVYAVAELK